VTEQGKKERGGDFPGDSIEDSSDVRLVVLNRECGGSTESGGHEAGSEGLGTEVGTWIWKWDAPAQMRSSNLSISLGRYNRDWRQHVGETLSGLPNSLIRRVNTKAGEMVQFLVERGKREGERERERERGRGRERTETREGEVERERERERDRGTRNEVLDESTSREQEDHCRIADRPATECAIFITRALVIAIRGRARKSRTVQPAGENAFGDGAHHRGHKFQSRRYDRTESSAETRAERG